MRVSDLFTMSTGAIVGSKLRSSLTLLGIVAGVASIIAVMTAIHMAWLGPEGLRELALRCARGARYAREALVRIPGVEPAVAAPSLYEFAVRTPRPAAEVLEKLAEEGFLGGLDLTPDYPELGEALLVTVTETRTRADIDAYVTAFEKAVA